MRENRMLRAKWRGQETGLRSALNGHEGGNPGHSQGRDLRGTAPDLDPTDEHEGRVRESGLRPNSKNATYSMRRSMA